MRRSSAGAAIAQNQGDFEGLSHAIRIFQALPKISLERPKARLTPLEQTPKHLWHLHTRAGQNQARCRTARTRRLYVCNGGTFHTGQQETPRLERQDKARGAFPTNPQVHQFLGTATNSYQSVQLPNPQSVAALQLFGTANHSYTPRR